VGRSMGCEWEGMDEKEALTGELVDRLDANMLRIGRIVVGILYLWVRDAGILGMEGAVKYVRDHWAMLVNGQGFELSDKRIMEFLCVTIGGSRIAGHGERCRHCGGPR
jgi:hypothetical protein